MVCPVQIRQAVIHFIHGDALGYRAHQVAKIRIAAGNAVTVFFIYTVSPLISYHLYAAVDAVYKANGDVSHVILRNPHGPAGRPYQKVTYGDIWNSTGQVSWGVID